MANEITIQFSMSRTDAVVTTNTHNIPLKSLSITQSQKTHCGVMATIGTTEETVVFTDMLVNGCLFLHNMDVTNYVEIGTTTGDYPIKLKAGEFAFIRLNVGKTLYAKANTTAIVLRAVQYPD